MKTNRRQYIIFKDLLTYDDGFLSYSFFCDKLNITEKTLREDIKKINASIMQYDMSIKLKRGKGFYLKCNNRNIKQELIEEFSYRFELIDESEESKREYLEILIPLFTNDNIKLEKLSSLTYLSTKILSNKLKRIRMILSSYNMTIKRRPYYGLKVVGSEIAIRYCLVDSLFFYENKNSLYFNDEILEIGITKKEIEDITRICSEFIKQSGLRISEAALRKIIVLIMISNRRMKKCKTPTFTKQQKQLLIENFTENLIDKLIKDIQDYYGIVLNENEKDFLKVVILINLDYSYDEYIEMLNDSILEKAKTIKEMFKSILIEINLEKANKELFLSKGMNSIIIQAILRSSFEIIEQSPFSLAKKYVKISPLSSSISTMLFNKLEKAIGKKIGELIRINMTLSIYESIRKVVNIKKLCNIAIFTPYDKEVGYSLERRILDRFANIIKKIDVLTSYDILSKDLDEYTHLIYFEDVKPLNLHQNIEYLKVNYFFTNEDISNFYEKIAVPARIYKMGFAKRKKEAFVFDSETIRNIDDVFSYCKEMIDSSLLKQLEYLSINSSLIYKDILNIVLFTNTFENTFTKFIKLKKPILYKNTLLRYIYINVINIDADPIALKTSEKIIRNITTLGNGDDFKQNVFNENPIDFVKWYTNDIKEQLE